MAVADELDSLLNRINMEFDDWYNFYDHTKTVWRTFQQWAGDGHTLNAENIATGHKYDQTVLADLSQYYMTQNLAPFTLQRFSSTFEVFLFEYLRIILPTNPGVLGGREITLGEAIKAGSISQLIAEAIEDKLNKIRYEKPKDWFVFADSVQKVGCPTADEIAGVAEIKATRDVLEHNSGIVSAIYTGKAGSKARFKEGDFADVPDPYLRDSWQLLRKICNDMTKAAVKVLSLKPAK